MGLGLKHKVKMFTFKYRLHGVCVLWNWETGEQSDRARGLESGNHGLASQVFLLSSWVFGGMFHNHQKDLAP